jgi:hypothetical protein
MFFKQFKMKQVRYGSFSTAMLLLAVILFIFINLIAAEFNRNWDLTDEQLATLSEHSINFLQTLDEEVTLTMVAPTGTHEPILAALLDAYAAASRYIQAEIRDPMINPVFVQRFAATAGAVPDHSIIVQSGDRYRVITPYMMVTPRFSARDEIIGVASFNFERQITTAIHALTRGEIAVVYKVVGSGEVPLGADFILFLEGENFIVNSVSGIELIQNGVPADADILLFSTPRWDWPAEKADAVLAFLDAGGRAMFAIEPFVGGRMPQFDRVLAAYGVRISDFVVMDPDPRQHIMLPMFTMPQLWPHEINLPLAMHDRMTLFLSFAAAVEATQMQRATTTVEPLLITSVTAFGRSDMHLESPLFHEDVDFGPSQFMTAAVIIDQLFAREDDTKIVVVGSSDIWAAGSRDLVGENNYAFAASALGWLAGQGPGLFVPVRTPGVSALILNQFESNIIAGISMGALPAILALAGFIVWLRRRHS